MDQHKNYWPQGIVLMVLAVVILIIFTINFAIKSGIEMDNMYMSNYQAVDESINELVISQKKFEEEYRVSKVSERFEIGKNNFSFKVESLKGLPLSDLNASCLLSRPHTTKEDQKIDSAELANDTFTCKDIEIQNKGRYEVGIILKNKDFGAYYNYEINSSM